MEQRMFTEPENVPAEEAGFQRVYATIERLLLALIAVGEMAQRATVPFAEMQHLAEVGRDCSGAKNWELEWKRTEGPAC